MQREIFQAFICYHFDGLQLMKTPNSKSQKIRILHEINKKRISTTNMSAIMHMYSVLGLGPFRMNYCLNTEIFKTKCPFHSKQQQKNELK